MDFVLGIDEMLFNGLLPKVLRDEVADVNFLRKGCGAPVRCPGILGSLSDDLPTGPYRKSLVYILCALSFVYIYAEYLTLVLPSDVRELAPYCNIYRTDTLS